MKRSIYCDSNSNKSIKSKPPLFEKFSAFSDDIFDDFSCSPTTSLNKQSDLKSKNQNSPRKQKLISIFESVHDDISPPGNQQNNSDSDLQWKKS